MTRKYHTTAVDGDPIVIVGLACRLPGDCESPSSLWKLLVDGQTGRGPIPPSKLGVDNFLRDANGQTTDKGLEGYYLQRDTRAFDNNFFGIHSAEATYMDPQQRNLLEVVYECFESAGVRLDQVSGSNTGCYVANFTQDFAHMQTRDLQRLNRHSATGMGSGILSNRISHAFNMVGPSLVLDTACSSSIYSLHVACSALEMDECDAAIVAGANLIQSVEQYIAMGKTGVISPTMTCHTFSEEADGYVRAEGVCALYIKRLRAALQNNDPIRAVIRGSAVGSNGKTAGISAPDVEAQARVIRQAYRKAKLNPRETSYVECHGTGTPKGDPVEIEALSKVFVRDPEDPLFIGSIKPNIGHGEGVSGLSGIIKTVLALEAHQIPPTVNVNVVNPQIRVADYSFEVVRKNRVWAPVTFSDSPLGAIRRAGVNAFGYGGANGHVIIEAADMWADPRSHLRSNESTTNGLTASNRITFLLLFSAASMESLKSRVSAIESKRDFDIARLAYTLACRRTHFHCRGYMTVRKDNITEDLRLESLKTLSSLSKPTQAPLTFVFTGQGAQWPGMGRELFDDYAVFRQSIRRMDTVLQKLAHPPVWSIEGRQLSHIYSLPIHLQSPDNNIVILGILSDVTHFSPINISSYSQPITTAIQIAITDLLSSLDVRPSFVIGHSSGEIAAAFAAGQITMEQAIITAYYRGYVNGIDSNNGGMLAVGLSVSEAVTKIRELHLESKIKVGCHNSPSNVTVTGDMEAILQLSEALQAQDIFARKLKTGGKAYHSQHMIALGPMLEQLLQPSSSYPANPKDPSSVVEFISTVTATRKESDFDASYWRANMESPVLFHESVEHLLEKRSVKFVEIGPHSALELPIRQIIAGLGREKEKLFYCPSLRRGKNETQCIHDLLGQLYLHNHNLSFGNVNSNGTKLGVIHDLPPYPWDHSRLLWSEPRISSELRTLRQSHHELLGTMILGGDGRFMQWKNELRLEDVPWLTGHQVEDNVVFPAAGYIAMAIEAVTQVAGFLDTTIKIELRRVSFNRALVVGDAVELFTTLRPKVAFPANAASGWWEYEINSYQNGSSSPHCKGSIMVQKYGADVSNTRSASTITPQSLAPQVFYPELSRKGLNFDGKFQSLEIVYDFMNDEHPFPRSVVSRLKQSHIQSSCMADPILIDAMLQAGIIANARNSVSKLATMVPVSLESAVVIVQSKQDQELAELVQAHTDDRPNGIIIDAELIDVKNRIVATLNGAKMTSLHPPSLGKPTIKRSLAANIVWKPAVFLTSWTAHDIYSQIDRVITSNRLTTGEPLAESWKSLHLLSLLTFALPNINVLELCDSLMIKSTARYEFLLSTTPSSNYHVGSFSAEKKIEIFQPIAQNTGDIELQPRLLDQAMTYDAIVISSNASEQELNFILTFLSPNGFMLTSSVNVEQPKLLASKLRLHSQIAEAISEWLERSKLTSTITLNRLISDANTLIIEPDSPGPANVALGASIAHLLGPEARRLSISQFSESDVTQNAVIISTVEAENPLLSSINDSELNKVKILTNRASKILWISGDSVLKRPNPDFALVSGLSRTLMLEQPSLSFYVFHLTQHDIELPHTANNILSVLQQEPGMPVDYEFAQENGVLHISRVTWDTDVNERFHRCSFGSEEPNVSRQVENKHLLLPGGDLTSDVPLKRQEISAPRLADDFVEVEVITIGLGSYNRSLNMNASYDEDSIWMNSFCGSVSRIGTNISDVRIGDHVVAMAPCKFRPFLKVPSWACLKLRNNDQVETVAAIPYVYSTAILALNHRARIQAGETIFIQGGASALGIAAILISQLVGAHVLTSVYSIGERDLLTQKLYLDESQIVTYPNESVAYFVHTATEGYGADVVLNLVDSQISLDDWKICAPFGRFLVIAKEDNTKFEDRVMENCLRHNVTYFTVNLAEIFYDMHSKSRKAWSKLLKDAMTLYWDGQIPSPIQVRNYTIDAVAKSLDASSDWSLNSVTVRLGGLNRLVDFPRYQTVLDPSKLYVIVGGFGGIGSAVTVWMLSRGARRFLLLGRSADSKNKALVPYLESQGANLKVLRCNIADQDEVRRCLLSEEDIIGGVIHSAMDLRESVFTEMTGKAWRMGIGTKVQGCWNLHSVLEERQIGVDFFVLISSTYGSFGGIAQSNYCAANHFLDQFARYRRSLGLPAVSLALGILSDVGYISENPEIEYKLKRSGISNLNHEEMLLLLDIALSRAAQRFGTFDQAHILTGIEQEDHQKDRNNRAKGTSIFTKDPRVRNLNIKSNSPEQSSESTAGHSSNFSRAAGKELLTDKAVTALINETLADFFSVAASAFIGSNSLIDYGMDSMLATEIRTWLYQTFNVDISLFKILSKTTTAESLTALTMEALGLK